MAEATELLGDEDSADAGYTPTEEDQEWLDLSRSAFEDSTDWLDANLRRQMERNYANFRSTHPPGSKYYTDAYRHRAKGFRPKLRSAVRKNEAAASAAFFSTNKYALISAENSSEPTQVASAAVLQELIQYRLSETIPWMLLCLGAFQETQVNGAVIGAVEWRYREKTAYVPAVENDMPVLDEDGEPLYDEKKKVLQDEPHVRLVPLENFRFSPSADWTNPILDSPYLIELMPMSISDILERMEQADPKTGEPAWRPMSVAQIGSATTYEFDTTRMAREGNRQDPKDDRGQAISRFRTAWVQKVIIRIKGEDWLYYTLGTEYLLSEPKRLSEVFLHGMRPYELGICILEAFRTYPSGVVELGQDLQASANELSNQRRDNVNLVLNKRYHIKRGQNVDLNALMRNTPGGGVMMDEIDAVEVINTPDVTSSSYQEQDRINVDFDEITGQFSQSTVQSNRSLNETVGGLELMSSGSNQMTEYLIKVFAVTFAERILKQLVALEQAYETDEIVLALAGDRAKLFQKFGIDEITDELLRQRLTTKVDLGIDATDPIRRIEKFTYALAAIERALALPGINKKATVDEVMGAIGYSNSAQFFSDLEEEQDPQIAQLMEQIQVLTQQIETDQAKIAAKGQADAQVAQIAAEGSLAVERMKADGVLALKEAEHARAIEKLSLQLDAQIQIARENNEAVEDREASKADFEIEKLKAELKNTIDEMAEDHQNKLEQIEAQSDRAAEDKEKDRKHETSKVAQMAEYQGKKGRASALDSKAAKQESSTMPDDVAETLKSIKERVDAIAEGTSTDSAQDQLKAIKALVEEVKQAQNAQPKRTINYDANGDPISITIAGRGTVPILKDAKGRVKTLGEAGGAA